MIIIDHYSNYGLYKKGIIINLTRSQYLKLNRLSPFYPYGGIPIPFSLGICCKSVFDVWKTLRVIDDSTGLNIFRNGLGSNEYLDLVTARRNILIPLYCWMLENKAYELIEYLRKMSKTSDIVILDKSICCDIDKTDVALSISYLLKSYLESSGPYTDAIQKKFVKKIVMVGRKIYTKTIEVYIPNKISNIDIVPRLPFDYNIM